jgi:hypothetical protein
MVDAANNVAMVYTRSSRTEFPSAYYTGRLVTDQPRTFRRGMVLKAGEVKYEFVDGGRNRFVDYTGAALDPADGSIWLIGMYSARHRGSLSTVPRSWVGNVKLLGHEFSYRLN